jgi:hypothetical protein
MLHTAGCSRKESARSEPGAGSASAAVQPGAASVASALALPGACVDPQADARKRATAKDLGADVVDAMVQSPAPDLDGDGTPDVLFGLGLGTTEALLLYVTRGQCARYVGEVNVASITALPTKTSGLRDLTGEDSSHCEGSMARCTPKKRTYHFDGTAYREVASAGAEKPPKKPAAGAAATTCGPNQHFDAINKVCRALGECPKGYRWNEPMQSCVDDGG